VAKVSELDGSGQRLVCRVCGAECSSEPGDYFAFDPDAELCCCGQPVVLLQHPRSLSAEKRLTIVAGLAQRLLDGYTTHDSECECPECRLRAALAELVH